MATNRVASHSPEMRIPLRDLDLARLIDEVANFHKSIGAGEVVEWFPIFAGQGAHAQYFDKLIDTKSSMGTIRKMVQDAIVTEKCQIFFGFTSSFSGAETGESVKCADGQKHFVSEAEAGTDSLYGFVIQRADDHLCITPAGRYSDGGDRIAHLTASTVFDAPMLDWIKRFWKCSPS